MFNGIFSHGIPLQDLNFFLGICFVTLFNYNIQINSTERYSGPVA